MISLYLLYLAILDIKYQEIELKWQLLLLAMVIINVTLINILWLIIMLIVYLLLNYQMKNKMGGADYKILLILTIKFGSLIITIQLIATILALIYLSIKKFDRQLKIPFVPFIFLGVVLCQILLR